MAENVLMSASRPAPPEGSTPAMDNTFTIELEDCGRDIFLRRCGPDQVRRDFLTGRWPRTCVRSATSTRTPVSESRLQERTGGCKPPLETPGCSRRTGVLCHNPPLEFRAPESAGKTPQRRAAPAAGDRRLAEPQRMARRRPGRAGRACPDGAEAPPRCYTWVGIRIWTWNWRGPT